LVMVEAAVTARTSSACSRRYPAATKVSRSWSVTWPRVSINFRAIGHCAGEVRDQAEGLLELLHHRLRLFRCRGDGVDWIGKHDGSSRIAVNGIVRIKNE